MQQLQLGEFSPEVEQKCVSMYPQWAVAELGCWPNSTVVVSL